MKRDMELVRKILFTMEESNKMEFSINSPPEVGGYPNDVVIYHMQIMSQANLLYYEKIIDEQEYNLIGQRHPYKRKFTYENFSISWQGHEFLDALRDDKRWLNVKKIMSEAGGFITEIAVEIAKESIKKAAFGLLKG